MGGPERSRSRAAGPSSRGGRARGLGTDAGQAVLSGAAAALELRDVALPRKPQQWE